MAVEVVLLHYSAPPVVGGVEAVLAEQARRLKDAGYPVRVVAGRGRHAEVLPLLYGRHPEVQRAHEAAMRGDLAPVWRLAERIASELAARLEGCVCLAHNVFTTAKNLPLLAALHRLLDDGARCRWVAWTHDVVWDNPSELARVPAPLREFLRARPEVTYVATSEAVRRSLAGHLGLDGAGVEVIPPGVSFEGLGLVGPQARRVVREVRWQDRYPVLLVPVRVTRRKNLELAVRVAACLRGRGLDPLVVVTGPLGAHTSANARYLEELQQLRDRLGVRDHVVFLTERGLRCSPRTVGELYLLCDAVLVPSVLEGFGLPVAEAGLLRVPVFCSRIPTAVEVAGPLASFFDLEESPESVAERIVRELSNDRASGLRRRVAERFAWDQVTRRGLIPLVERLCRQVVGGGLQWGRG
ncbi:MAG: glycosyltransferase family 4 protein [Armatimonadota bacterium]|nr:glycosyltransferase family 4 protein [Armatimonadota bacterium]MDW8155579.1 glycosyltransferase family 4 protein [Armatimonadota bacterium]